VVATCAAFATTKAWCGLLLDVNRKGWHRFLMLVLVLVPVPAHSPAVLTDWGSSSWGGRGYARDQRVSVVVRADTWWTDWWHGKWLL
jgi:hypothetical protein